MDSQYQYFEMFISHEHSDVDGCHCFLVKVTSVPFASEPFGLFFGGNQFRMSSLAQRRQVAYLYPSKLIIQFRGQQMRWTNPMIESKHSNNINKLVVNVRSSHVFQLFTQLTWNNFDDFDKQIPFMGSPPVPCNAGRAVDHGGACSSFQL